MPSAGSHSSLSIPVHRLGTPWLGSTDTVQRWQASIAGETSPCFLGSLCFVMQSVAGQSCVPHRVAATFSHSTIDSKKKIRYTVPHLFITGSLTIVIVIRAR